MQNLKKKLFYLYVEFYKLIFQIYLKSYKYYTLYFAPYIYREENYKGSFITNRGKSKRTKLEKANEIIYLFWTGNNKIPQNRLRGIESIKKRSEVKVVLVDSINLRNYILEDFPLHPAFEYLSFIHRSDYLRCYFMLHYGGGYSDIKPCLMSWKPLFKELNASAEKWCIAPREKNKGGVPVIEGKIGSDIKKYHNNLITNCTFIYKPNSPLALEWMEEVNKRLDYFLPELKKSNSSEYGGDDYPLPWSFIMGQVMHPLVLKYHERMICKDINLFSTSNYR